MFKALQGQEVADADAPGLDGYVPARPVEVAYNSQLPPVIGASWRWAEGHS